ncbi:uncharacterized protein [Palaemon carinicauda]|uniref:uncharacterized protein n=1 Tax=Palaemon carinicauda TaxID=392227 RepID=UPI0035B5ADDA
MIHLSYILIALGFLLCARQMNGEWNRHGNAKSNKPMSVQGDSGWQAVGELVELKESEMLEDEEEQMVDVSEPKIISDSVCYDILMTLDENPQNVTETLQGLKLDQPRWTRGSCLRSRDFTTSINLQGFQPSFCYGPLYVVYAKNRYCCRHHFEHPILQKRGSRMRCRCLYEL